MKHSDLKEFAKCMALMQETFVPDKPISDMKMDMYFNFFKDVTIEQFREACYKICQTKKISTFPLPAEISEMLSGNTEDQAIIAFETFRAGKERTGIYASVIFTDKVIHAVIRSMGGWQQVCLITEDEWRFKRKEFLDLYKTFSKHLPPDVPEKLIGLIEYDNEARGFSERIPEPKIIGTTPERKQIEHEVTA